MRSKLKVLVAVFLMAAMVFTMFPASAIAGPKGKGNRKPGVTVEETQAPETEVVETEAPTEEVETETVIETEAVTEAPVVETEAPAEVVYSAKTLEGTESDISVKVEAPEGALPDGTEMVLTTLTPEEFAAVEEKVDGNVVEAIDIAFWNNDEEIEPLIPIVVTMSSAKIAEVEDTTVVHIADETGEATQVEQLEEAAAAADEVVFEADSFSVYAVVVNEAGDEATIHWGYMDGTSFVELEEGSTVTMDTTASSLSLENSFEGYYYLDAVYCTPGQTIEQGVDIKATLYKTTNGWACDVVNSEDSTVTRTDIEANSNIYVTYFQPGEGQTKPSGADDDNIPSPTTTKTVTDNGDGTYTIQLDIEGATVEEDHSHYANILVILDATRSMNGTKWTNAKAAMKALIETLTEGENAANAGKIDFALVTFGRSATVNQTWTKDNTTFKSTCAGLNMVTTSGTNWEAGMRGGLYGVLNNLPDDDPTYVIFLTDGDPNVYYQSGSDTNYTNSGTTSGYNQNSNTSANHSADEAKAIAAKTKLYGIYCGDSGVNPSGESFNRLVNVITGTGQGGVKTIAANANTIENEFKLIAQTMLDEMGASNVAADDGVPSLAGISANVTGEAGGYEYYIKGKNDSDFSEWNDAPGATYSNDNGVTWDLSKVGTLPEGTTYRIRFTVWPSQAAYDLIADLNNGLKDYDDLTDKEKAAVTGNKEDGYTLVTNTHLNTTYTFKDQDYSDAPDDLQYASMPLPTKTISVKKIWPTNALGDYGEAVYRDENGNEQTATEIKLNLQKDKADYLDVTVKSSEGWEKDDIYVSCGNMSIKDGNVTIHEPGHDYQIVEPAAFSYYWDLISDVYHPMVINGTATLLVLDEKATSADNVNTFEINGKFYTKHADNDNTLEAYNYRRSNLNLTKVVSTTGAKADDYFTYTATVKDANSTDGKVWFSAWDPEANATVKDADWVISGATAQEGNTGYWSANNGATVTFKIKAGWNVRFLNLFHGSTFSFEETGMPDFYEFEKAETEHQFAFMDKDIKESDWQTITDKKVEGTIVEPNNSYTVTYTNKFEAFYVYHSGIAGDGNLEVVGMPKSGKYDLTQNVTANTLYGGYYLDYAGKGDYKDDGVKGTTGVAYTGMNYNWSGAQTVKGTEITPVAGETYYIKEVPTYYLRNYYQINYMKESGELKALYLISAVDDLNYSETGFVLATKNQKAKVVSQMTFKNYSTGKSVTLKANTVFRSLGIDKAGEYLTYFDATGSEYFAEGEFTVLPYWITPDSITVKGISTRTITISSMTKTGITKSDD